MKTLASTQLKSSIAFIGKFGSYKSHASYKISTRRVEGAVWRNLLIVHFKIPASNQCFGKFLLTLSSPVQCIVSTVKIFCENSPFKVTVLSGGGVIFLLFFLIILIGCLLCIVVWIGENNVCPLVLSNNVIYKTDTDKLKLFLKLSINTKLKEKEFITI